MIKSMLKSRIESILQNKAYGVNAAGVTKNAPNDDMLSAIADVIIEIKDVSSKKENHTY